MKPTLRKKGLVEGRAQLLHRPFSNLVISHFLIVLGEGSPIRLRSGPSNIGEKIIESLPAGRFGTGSGELAAI